MQTLLPEDQASERKRMSDDHPGEETTDPIAAVARLIAGKATTPELVEGLRTAARYLRDSIEVDAKALHSQQLADRLTQLLETFALIQRELDLHSPLRNWAIGEAGEFGAGDILVQCLGWLMGGVPLLATGLADGGAPDIASEDPEAAARRARIRPYLDHSTQILEPLPGLVPTVVDILTEVRRHVEVKRGPARGGLIPQEHCAAFVAAAWNRVHGCPPGATNRTAQEACAALWLYTGGSPVGNSRRSWQRRLRTALKQRDPFHAAWMFAVHDPA
jgi:hypothetical protein